MSHPEQQQDTLPFLNLLPNLVTLLGLCAGLTSIRFTLSGGYEIAAALIVVAAVIDALDGRLARRLKATSDFGAELDSLADFLNFGVAPGILVHAVLLGGTGGLGWILVLVFACCCCMRLARFNVGRIALTEDEPDDIDEVAAKQDEFVGVPAPAGALLGLLPAFLTFEGTIDAGAVPFASAVWLGLVGAAMISTLRTPSVKSVRVQKRWIGVVIIGAIALIGLMVARFWLTMIIIDLLYLAALARLLVGRFRRQPE